MEKTLDIISHNPMNIHPCLACYPASNPAGWLWVWYLGFNGYMNMKSVSWKWITAVLFESFPKWLWRDKKLYLAFLVKSSWLKTYADQVSNHLGKGVPQGNQKNNNKGVEKDWANRSINGINVKLWTYSSREHALKSKALDWKSNFVIEWNGYWNECGWSWQATRSTNIITEERLFKAIFTQH